MAGPPEILQCFLERILCSKQIHMSSDFVGEDHWYGQSASRVHTCQLWVGMQYVQSRYTCLATL